jgi:hypothetical protein
MRSAARLACVLLIGLVAASCGEPPNKEMDQAEGAIEAARAAGAEQYAATELAAAQEALRSAVDAVDARDYRLALGHALESRDQAQNAARVAADTRERLRGELERALADITTRLVRARDSLGAASGTRAQRRAHEAALEALATADGRVQEASARLESGDYAGARVLLDEVRAQIDEVTGEASTAP